MVVQKRQSCAFQDIIMKKKFNRFLREKKIPGLALPRAAEL